MGWHGRLLAALAAVSLLSSCVCTADDCGSTESATVHLMRSASELQGARALACRNEACQMISLQPLADGLVGASKVSLDITDPNPNEGVVLDPYAQTSGDGFVLTFVWGFDRTKDLQVGDHLSVSISNAEGDELFAGAAKFAVLDRDPGDSCGPGCINADLSLD